MKKNEWLVALMVFKSHTYSIMDGATPKVTTSASESSSLPMGDDTWSRRAAMPSKKSKTAPMMMNAKARVNRPIVA